MPWEGARYWSPDIVFRAQEILESKEQKTDNYIETCFPFPATLR